MMGTQSSDAVRTEVVVEVGAERAFTVFTQEMGTWWDPDHHLLDGVERLEVEPFAGGTITEHAADGRACTWARVLVHEPPARFAFTWDIAPDFTLEDDLSRASEVEVTFTPEGPSRTRVVLEHRHLERHGDDWERLRDAVGGDNGWPHIAARFAAAAR
jgi:hypothetical protein